MESNGEKCSVKMGPKFEYKWREMEGKWKKCGGNMEEKWKKNGGNMEGKWSKMEEIWRKSYPHCSPLLMVGVQLHREHMRVLSYLAKMKILQTENEEFHSKMGKHRRVGETQAGCTSNLLLS